jgi:hypothetical protein
MRYSLQLNLYKKNAEKDSELVQWGKTLQTAAADDYLVEL